MKVAALIFTIFGMIVEIYVLLYTNWVLGVIGLVVGAIMIASLCANKKNTAVGILGILFTGILGGVLYLCWNPED